MAKTELKILIGLHRAVNYIDRQSTKIFSEYQLTLGQFAVLEALYHKGDMTIGQVQEKILSSSGTMPLIINNLEKRGYLIRETDSKDKRRCILHITAQGQELIGQVYPRNEARIIELMSHWTDEEKKELAILLKKFGDEINGEKG
ncbi:MarR family winged helix-turn-helix transcriptional regulator [Lacrimispora brassicae]